MGRQHTPHSIRQTDMGLNNTKNLLGKECVLDSRLGSSCFNCLDAACSRPFLTNIYMSATHVKIINSSSVQGYAVWNFLSEAQQLAQGLIDAGRVSDLPVSAGRSGVEWQPGTPGCGSRFLSMNSPPPPILRRFISTQLKLSKASFLSSPRFICLFVYAWCAYRWAYMYVYTHKPEAYTKELPGFLSTSLIEAGSLTGPRACWVYSTPECYPSPPNFSMGSEGLNSDHHACTANTLSTLTTLAIFPAPSSSHFITLLSDA